MPSVIYFAGHYISGVSRGTEAMMTATMIGFAIAFIFQLFLLGKEHDDVESIYSILI